MNKMTKMTKLATAAMLLAVGMLLPFLTGQIPAIGSRISPLHLPVLVCGFFCGWQYGLAAGLVLPLLRSFVFGMPPLMPSAVAMAVEMGVYGLVSGILYQVLPPSLGSVYGSLIGAMICGRIAWGLVNIPLYGIVGKTYSFQIFLAGALINAVPAIILQLLLIPAVVMTVKRRR